ncbi:unnamed protein product [Phaedon cochleariae]|uniref:Microtubule-associated protein Jupiter n=1 Tax=Phaedon cochleariae TaxID=80249 RepID=A0A9P0DQB5_PHACE|nr:unnamed protein product [Phaedon cochleariae]
MTSTKFNIGLDEVKNSSRVLKPPGGGHTDIFGINGDNEFLTPNKRKNHPSSITGCFTHEENVRTDNRTKDEGDVKNGNGAADENTKPNHDTEGEEKKHDENNAAPARRVRVPPGGFSSGLW